MTNQDIIEGQLKQVQGKVEDAYGDLTNSPEHDAHGKAKVAEGNVQEGVGHIKEAIQNAVKTTAANEAAERDTVSRA